jgi:glycosyltransferase involved in cell wall biosynthesis
VRIFIGFTDIANIASTYARAFRALGHQTFTVAWSRSYFYPQANYDVIIDRRSWTGQPLNRWGKLKALMGALGGLMQFPKALRCDVFITFAPALLPTHLIYPWLKRRGKRLVCAFWGSDIRYWYAFAEEMRLLGVDQEVQPFVDYSRVNPGPGYQDKLRMVRSAERYADLILSQPGYGQLQTKPYMRANIPLDLSELEFHIPDRQVPLVLHAPSVRGVKGTEYVLAAVELLKAEGVPFEFQLIEKLPNAELHKLLTSSDIVIDELFSETVATLSAEGMATGNAVLVRYMPEFAGVPGDCPAINVTTDSLTEKLRAIILDRDLRRQLARAGRPYVEAHNDHLGVATQILDWLRPNRIQKYDFTPTFYRNFHMPAHLIAEERKKMWQLRRQTLNKYLSVLPAGQR